jgi:hypothetical protein
MRAENHPFGHRFRAEFSKNATLEAVSESPAKARVSFDLRRNLINILGDDHYPYAEFLYHELAANAWDEDATEVRIHDEISQKPARGRPQLFDISFEDNGSGMDLEGLNQYFTVGESGKIERKVSEIKHRALIGRLGVGKVAILKVARQWELVTERHLHRDRPVRLRVEVDVDSWVSGAIDGFEIEELEPTGSPGTRMLLRGVRTRMREDRVIRHLQRLPLGPDFKVWRNNELVPPRQWHGIEKVTIDTVAEWEEHGEAKSGTVKGEIWVRPKVSGRKATAYIEEPDNEKDGLERDPAGIEVRVDHDVITREFFGHETHGHGVNRIWGWVDVPWLPILGNRTDYLRDSPAGHAFYETVKRYFDEVYGPVRSEHDSRARKRGKSSDDDKSPGSDSPGDSEGASDNADDGDTSTDADGGKHEALAASFGEALNRLLHDRPELTPVVSGEAPSSRGRPRKDRVYPVRPDSQGRTVPFEDEEFGESLAVREDEGGGKTLRAASGSVLRRASSEAAIATLGEIVQNPAAGIRVDFAPLGRLEAPYRWNLDEDPPTLGLNIDHKLFRSLGDPATDAGRLHAAWLVALAFAELANPSRGQLLADYLETVSYELFFRLKGR